MLESQLAFPSIDGIIYVLQNGTVVNCLITVEYVKRFNTAEYVNVAESAIRVINDRVDT